MPLLVLLLQLMVLPLLPSLLPLLLLPLLPISMPHNFRQALSETPLQDGAEPSPKEKEAAVARLPLLSLLKLLPPLQLLSSLRAAAVLLKLSGCTGPLLRLCDWQPSTVRVAKEYRTLPFKTSGLDVFGGSWSMECCSR